MTPQSITHQAPLSTEFSRQAYWSGLPFPTPENLPNPENRTWVLKSTAWKIHPLQINVTHFDITWERKKETSIMIKALYTSGFLCYSILHNLNYILFMNLFPFSLNEDSNNHPVKLCQITWEVSSIILSVKK